MDVPLPGFMEPVEERSSQFRKQEAVFVRRVARTLGVVVGHQGIETRHQALDVDATSLIQTSFPVQQTARVGQSADPGFEDIVAEIVDEQRRAGNQGAGEPGAGDHDVIAGDGQRGVRIPRGGFRRRLDPSRKSGGALHRLHCFCLEFDGACEVQRRVPTDWIIEPIDVSGHGSFSLAS